MSDESARWDAARAGDSRAFTGLFNLHVDRLFRHACRLGLEATAAEEVASAAFFELWRRRDAVRLVDGSVLPWLLVTTTNLARNANRGMSRYRALLERMPRERPVGVDELVAARARRQGLAAAVARLGPVDAALVTLTLIEGYSVTEAATAVGVSAAAGRARLSRARRRLRVDLEPQAEEFS